MVLDSPQAASMDHPPSLKSPIPSVALAPVPPSGGPGLSAAPVDDDYQSSSLNASTSGPIDDHSRFPDASTLAPLPSSKGKGLAVPTDDADDKDKSNPEDNTDDDEADLIRQTCPQNLRYQRCRDKACSKYKTCLDYTKERSPLSSQVPRLICIQDRCSHSTHHVVENGELQVHIKPTCKDILKGGSCSHGPQCEWDRGRDHKTARWAVEWLERLAAERAAAQRNIGRTTPAVSKAQHKKDRHKRARAAAIARGEPKQPKVKNVEK